MKTFLSPVWYVCSCASLAFYAQGANPQSLIFEAEDWSEPKSAWLVNKDSTNRWNLWSTDKDADKKWSKGVVLRAPEARQNRQSSPEGAPPLHTRITGIPAGTYDVTIKGGRTLGVSRNGREWIPFRGGLFVEGEKITNGVFELWADDRFAETNNPGSAYYDYVELTRTPDPIIKPLVQGFARERVKEKLDRGVVALTRQIGGVYLGWRLLAEDPADVGFNIYRSAPGTSPQKINAQPITQTADYLDRNAPEASGLRYGIRPVRNGQEGLEEGAATVFETTNNCLVFKLEDKATFQKVGIGDLDGDGRYDYVLKLPNTNIDPADSYWKRSPDTYKLEARRSDGALLWRKDLGWAIEQGIWYSPYIVYDFDGDGHAEVAAKIGEGDPRNPDGRVTSGPEWLVIWDGKTGAEKSRVAWPDRSDFGEGSRQYNYASRNQIGVAFLDGKTPAIIAMRGTYTTMKVDAYELTAKGLRQLWTFRDAEGGRKYRGQGGHSTHAADIDGDGRDEIILGSSVLDDNGSPLWSTGLGHSDHSYVGDLNPQHPGLEIYYGIEPARQSNTMCMVDAKTGKLLWGWNKPTTHVHSRGMCADFDPTSLGSECYAADSIAHKPTGDRWLWSGSGNILSREVNFSFGENNVYWDGDLQREVIQQGKITDFRSQLALQAINGSIIEIADVLGDWREEIIVSAPGEMRIYTTTLPAMDHRATFMQDPIYRLDVAMNAMGYTLIALPSYALDAREPNLNLTLLPGGEVQIVVSAPLDKAVKGQVKLQCTLGKLTPADFAVNVGAGKLSVMKAKLDASLKRGQALELSAQMDAGKIQRQITTRGVFDERLGK